jgi:hypothetical protein
MAMRLQGVVGLLGMAIIGIACASETEEVSRGAPCGEVNCRQGEYCCDAACGLCIEAQVACILTCDDVTS